MKIIQQNGSSQKSKRRLLVFRSFLMNGSGQFLAKNKYQTKKNLPYKISVHSVWRQTNRLAYYYHRESIFFPKIKLAKVSKYEELKRANSCTRLS